MDFGVCHAANITEILIESKNISLIEYDTLVMENFLF